LVGTYGHTWSLAVEEHFYIFLPIMLYFMLRRARAGDTDPFRRLPLAFLLVAIFCLSARLVTAVLVQPYSAFAHLFPTHLRLDSLFFGVFLSYWYHFHSDRFGAWIRRARPFLFPLSVLLIMPAAILEQPDFAMYTVGLTSLYLGYGCLLLALLQVPLSTEGSFGWLLKPFSYIGQHSYPIYLFHIPIMGQLARVGLLRTWFAVPLYFAMTIAIGILLSKLIEFPVLHMRDRIFPPVVPPQAPTFNAESERPDPIAV
jgi:peptidoglycan/LPS O-acetylase OafA/YrhL